MRIVYEYVSVRPWVAWRAPPGSVSTAVLSGRLS